MGVRLPHATRLSRRNFPSLPVLKAASKVMENFTSFGPLPGTGWPQPYTPDFSRINLTPQDLVIGKHRCRQALQVESLPPRDRAHDFLIEM